ncbi:MAG: DUF2796 domain-containing protein [Rubrivivax sp.]|nr:DUF2796 domain-containing protein [Rubrivivax sp.]
MARLAVAVDAGRITLELEVPLADLTGFERAPGTEAERQAVAQVLGRLRELGSLVRPDVAAGCGKGTVELSAPRWQVGPAGAAAVAQRAAAAGKGPARATAGAAPDGHADLEATVDFRCPGASKAAFVDVALFEALPRLQRIDVQAATPRGQMKQVLRRPQGRIALAR